MFDTIILLTGPLEQAALHAALHGHNPRLTILAAETPEQLEAIPASTLRAARLIGFVTPVIVPLRILEALGYGAYNFHPGPPNYPGWAPSHFAAYDGAREFGATAHHMSERVDSGPIIGVDLFDMPDGGVVALEAAAFARLARLFWLLSKALATDPTPMAPVAAQWSGRKGTKRRCAELCTMTPDLGADEIHRRVAAFGGGYLGVVPQLLIHGHAFRYVTPDTQTPAVEQPALANQIAMAS